MRVQIDGSGNITDVERPDHLLSSGTVVAFGIGPPSAATGWPVGFTVTGTAGSRVLKDPHGQTVSVEESTQTAPDAGASGDVVAAAQTGVTTAQTPNYESGVGTYKVNVIGPDLGTGYVFGFMREGDAFPFLAVTDVGDWVCSDGTYDPTNHPVSFFGLQVGSGNRVDVAGGGPAQLRVNPDDVQVYNSPLVLTLLPAGADAPAPVPGDAALFSRVNGGGKTELCVRFGSGAIQVLSTEP